MKASRIFLSRRTSGATGRTRSGTAIGGTQKRQTYNMDGRFRTSRHLSSLSVISQSQLLSSNMSRPIFSSLDFSDEDDDDDGT
jgi:hypothetical protein